MIKIAVLGNGSWGSVLGSMLADNGNDVTLYGNIDSVNEEINAHHTNSHYMKDWKLNENTKATGDLEAALDGAELVLFVLPTNSGLAPVLSKTLRTFLATILTALVGKTNKTSSAPSRAASKSPVALVFSFNFQSFI